MSEALLDVADELYALSLGEFTPARDARAKEAKGDDPELAQQVRALRKPTTAAWVVNLLVRRESGQIEQVLEVGAALREAQAAMSADELRQLTRQRRQLTGAVTTRARQLAAEEGTRVTPAVADQVEATLTAAMVDEECARAVRSGLLVSPLSSTGVEDVAVAEAVAVPEALGFTATTRETGMHLVPDPDGDDKARAAAEAALAEAEEAVATARQEYDAATRDVGQLEAKGLQLQAEIDELKRRLDELETAYEENDDELSDAEAVRAEADDALAEAIRAHDRARAELDKVR